MYVCRYVCIYVCMYICTYVGMYVYMYVCIYVFMYVCIYQRSAVKCFFATHEILNKNESTILKCNCSDSFVLTTTLISKYRLQ